MTNRVLIQSLTGGSIILLVAIMIFIGAFGIGAYSGAEAATNESVHVEDYHQNITKANEEIEETLYGETRTWIERYIFKYTVGWMVDPAMQLVRSGVVYGYENPKTGRIVGKWSPLAIVLVYSIVIYWELKRVERWWR